jgi:FixJ family two-component response regulator
MNSDALVHLVDNDPQLLKAVSRLLTVAGFRTQASASAREFLSRYEDWQPGCLVLDLAMPGETGLDLQREMQRRDIALPIVFLSGCADVPSSVRAMKDGAIDFLTKPVDADALIGAVTRAVEFDTRQRARAQEEHSLHACLDALTPREREILPFLVSGKLNKQIAGDLGVVEKTVKVHRAHVMHKLGVRSLADLVRLASRLEIPPPSPRAPASSVGPRAN